MESLWGFPKQWTSLVGSEANLPIGRSQCWTPLPSVEVEREVIGLRLGIEEEGGVGWQCGELEFVLLIGRPGQTTVHWLKQCTVEDIVQEYRFGGRGMGVYYRFKMIKIKHLQRIL